MKRGSVGLFTRLVRESPACLRVLSPISGTFTFIPKGLYGLLNEAPVSAIIINSLLTKYILLIGIIYGKV